VHLRRTREPRLERLTAEVNRKANCPERWKANEPLPHHRLALAKVHPGIGPVLPWVLDVAKGRRKSRVKGETWAADPPHSSPARSSKYIPVRPACQRFKSPPEVLFWLLRRDAGASFGALRKRFRIQLSGSGFTNSPPVPMAVVPRFSCAVRLLTFWNCVPHQARLRHEMLEPES